MLRCGCLPSIFLQSLSVALLSCFPSFPSFAVSRVSVIMRSVFFQFVQFHIFYSLSYFLLFPYRYKNDLKLTYYYYLTIYFNRLHNIYLTCSQVELVVMHFPMQNIHRHDILLPLEDWIFASASVKSQTVKSLCTFHAT